MNTKNIQWTNTTTKKLALQKKRVIIQFKAFKFIAFPDLNLANFKEATEIVMAKL